MAQSEFDKWRRMDKEFDKYYNQCDYGEKALFVMIYRNVFNDWGYHKYDRQRVACIITASMPLEAQEKYKVKPGMSFESGLKLSQFVLQNTGINILTTAWKKKGWIK